MRAALAVLAVVGVMWAGAGLVWAFECPARIDEARTAQGYAEEARLIAERF